MCNTISRPLSIWWLLQVHSSGSLDARAPPTQLSYLIKISSGPIHFGKAKLATGIRGLTIDRALRCIAYGILTLDKASAKSCFFGIISIAISSGFQTNLLYPIWYCTESHGSGSLAECVSESLASAREMGESSAKGWLK